MGFRLVPKSVTLNDFERRNGVMAVLFALYAEFGSFGTEFRKSGWIYTFGLHFILRMKCSPKNLVFSGISIMAIFEVRHRQRER